MDYKEFEDKIISKIERNKSCTNTIKENQKLVNEYFVNCDSLTIIKEFVERLNDTIIKLKKFDEAEKFLKNPSLSEVLDAFRESDVLIRACEEKNKKAGKWLVTMGINTNIRDKKGMTALMHASTYYDLEEVVDALIKLNEDQINIIDEDGNTALFHAVKIKAIFDKLVKYKIDTNYRNRNGDTIFTHICRRHKPKLIKSLLTYHKDVDFAVVNHEGRTGAMYLAESDNYTELRGLKASGVDLNLFHKNNKNETIVSITINRLYDRFRESQFHDKYVNNIFQDNFKDSNDYTAAKHFARTMNALIDIGCDFNCVVDGDGNTPMLFFLMIKDYVSAQNLLQYCKTMDLNICNKYGISAASLASSLTKEDFNSLNNVKDHLFVKISYDRFKKELTNYPSYNTKLIDKPEMDLYSEVTPYVKPDKILSLQAALSEGYFARSGEDGNPDLFDKIFGPILGVNSAHPFV